MVTTVKTLMFDHVISQMRNVVVVPADYRRRIYVECNNNCTTDGDCGRGMGAQKCCSVDQCPGSKQCVDPVGLEECVYLG